jgi:hypothetical protein
MVASNHESSEVSELELLQTMRQKSDEELYDVILTGNGDEKYAAAVCLMTPTGDIEKNVYKSG